MVSTCCVPNCSTFQQKNGKLKFHRFPKSPTHKQKWIEALYKGKDCDPSDTSLVCGKHFTQFDYTVNEQGAEVLTKNAVPSVFDEEKKVTKGKVNAQDNDRTITAGENLSTVNQNTIAKIAPVVKKINKDNFMEICRCCVVNKGEVNIFETKFQNILLSDLIYFCTMERIPSRKNLPSSVCKTCKQQIINSFGFINKVRDNQVHIRKLQQIFSVKHQERPINSSFNNKPNKFHNTPTKKTVDINSQSEIKNSDIENFKEKYKGLAKVHNQLCNILLKNKMHIKKRVKTKSNKPSFLSEESFSCEVPQGQDSTSKQPDVCLKEKVSSAQISNTLQHSESILMKYLLSSKTIPTKGVAEDITNVSNDKSDTAKAENPSQTVKLKCTDDSEMELFPDYRDADNDIDHQSNTVSESELNSYVDKFVKSTSGKDIKRNNNGRLTEKEEENNETKMGTQCFECLEVFHTEAKIIRHCRLTGHVMADRFKCHLCSSTFRLKRIYKMHLQQHKEAKCICEICGARVFAKNIRRHLEVHNEMRNHICQFCGRSYSQKGALELHIKYNHYGEGFASLCFLCGKSFKTSSRLNKHLNDEHIADELINKFYQCEICEKFFISKVSLKFHQKCSHSENPIQRPIYEKMRKKMSADEKNGNSNQPKQQLRFKQCTICFKSVNATGYMKHMRIHQGVKPFECKVCGTHFRQNSHLKSHMNIHLNRKPYKCKYCQNCYRHSVSLISHMRSHTGERPYRCPVCDKGFVHLTTMKVHHQSHLKLNQGLWNQEELESPLSPKNEIVDIKEESEAESSDCYTIQFG